LRILRTSLIVLLAVLALTVSRGTDAATAQTASPVEVDLVRAIRHYRSTTRRLQHVMGSYRSLELARRGRPSLQRAARLWRRRAVSVKRRFLAGPPHASAWRCIHSYEGSWRDGGAPYYGGLQMDISFQVTYAPLLVRLKGTADNWTPLEQMWVAEKAYRSGRGFYPWPNTARYCGLI
jgi:hypothetical protein